MNDEVVTSLLKTMTERTELAEKLAILGRSTLLPESVRDKAHALSGRVLARLLERVADEVGA